PAGQMKSLWFNAQRSLEQWWRLDELIGLVRDGKVSDDAGSEILRAVIVFAHSVLEESIREVAIARFDKWPAQTIASVPLIESGAQRPEKFTFGDLLNHRGKGVAELLMDSAIAWVNSKSFSSVSDIVSFLERIGIPIKELIGSYDGESIDDYLAALQGVIQRRHQIVHHGDYDPANRTLERRPINVDEAAMACFRVVQIIFTLYTRELAQSTRSREEAIEGFGVLFSFMAGLAGKLKVDEGEVAES